MGAIALGVAGLALGAGGAAVSANSNSHKRSDVKSLAGDWQPDYSGYTDNYFKNLDKYLPQSQALSSSIGKSEMTDALALREQALPGIGKATQDASAALFPLLKGELPPEVLRAFNSSGAASSVGAGFGGSGYGFVNQGLFGARGALGAMQQGYSMLGALLGTMPQVHAPSATAFLQNIITPQQRVSDQLAFRGQQIGIGETAAGMPSGSDAWAKYLSSTGGSLMGAGMAAGGAGALPSGGGDRGNGTSGYVGTSDTGAQGYNVPTSLWGPNSG